MGMEGMPTNNNEEEKIKSAAEIAMEKEFMKKVNDLQQKLRKNE